MTAQASKQSSGHSGPIDADETVRGYVAGYGYSYAITSLLSALLVVLKESNTTVHDLMVSLTGHHWVTQGVFDIIVFVVLGWLLSRSALAKNASYGSLIAVTIGSTVISGSIIAGYFGL